MMTADELLKHDIQTAVYHELGHYHVARELGVTALFPEFYRYDE